MSTAGNSEASGPAAGYYYQIRYALLRALQILKKHPTSSISIEKLDDVAIEHDDGDVDLEQLKHSLYASKTYADSSKPVWRTIGNWARALSSGEIDPGTTRLYLTTNGQAAGGSYIARLGPDRQSVDIDEAVTGLTQVAEISTNLDTKVDRDHFLGLPTLLRRDLLASITLVENAPGLAALEAELDENLHFACDLTQLPELRSDLEGWWFSRVMQGWSQGKGVTIPLLEVEARVSYLRDKYKMTLAIDVGEVAEEESLEGRMFIEQIKAINASGVRIRNAQKDFLKAGAQRSKWLRELKIDPDELSQYDRDLVNRWSKKFEISKDELTSEDENEKCKCGRSILAWAELEEIPIRSAKAQFLTSGSYHGLADTLDVGWHPEFSTKFTK